MLFIAGMTLIAGGAVWAAGIGCDGGHSISRGSPSAQMASVARSTRSTKEAKVGFEKP